MKNSKLKFFLVLAMIITNVSLISAQNDFRKANWGMKPSEVKSGETSKISSEEQNKLIYECLLADIKGTIVYTFTVSGHLMRAKYYLTPDYINTNYYIRDFKMIQELLKQKYGEPSKKLVVSPTGKVSISEAEWAAYLSSGEMRVEYKWDILKTDITLTLSKIGEKPAIQIDYVSKEFNIVDIKAKKEIIMKDL